MGGSISRLPFVVGVLQRHVGHEDKENPLHVNTVDGTVHWKAPEAMEGEPGHNVLTVQFAIDTPISPSRSAATADVVKRLNVEFDIIASSFTGTLQDFQENAKVMRFDTLPVYRMEPSKIDIDFTSKNVMQVTAFLMDPFVYPRLMLVIRYHTKDITDEEREAHKTNTTTHLLHDSEVYGDILDIYVCIGDLVGHKAANPDFPEMTLSQLYSRALLTPELAAEAGSWADTIRGRMRPCAIELLNRGRDKPEVTEANLEDFIPLFGPGELPRQTQFEEVLLPNDPLSKDGNFDRHVVLFPCAMSRLVKVDQYLYCGKDIVCTISKMSGLPPAVIVVVDEKGHLVHPEEGYFYQCSLFTVFTQDAGPFSLSRAFHLGFQRYYAAKRALALALEGRGRGEGEGRFSDEARGKIEHLLSLIEKCESYIRRSSAIPLGGVVDTKWMTPVNCLVALLGRWIMTPMSPERFAFIGAVSRGRAAREVVQGLRALANTTKLQRNNGGGGSAGPGGGGSAGPGGGGSAGPGGGGSAGPGGGSAGPGGGGSGAGPNQTKKRSWK